MLRIPVLLSEAPLAHDIYVYLEHSSGALPPDIARHRNILEFVPRNTLEVKRGDMIVLFRSVNSLGDVADFYEKATARSWP